MATTKHQRELLAYAARRSDGRVHGGPRKSIRTLIEAGFAEERPVVNTGKDRELLSSAIEIFAKAARERLAQNDWRGALAELKKASALDSQLYKIQPFITDTGRAEVER